MILQSPQSWSDAVKEACAMESAERLLGIDANAAVTACTLLLPINAPSGCDRKWLSEILLQLLACTGVGNALDGQRGRGRDVSPRERTSREPRECEAPAPNINRNAPQDLDPGMGHVECADGRDIEDVNV